jgi:hypothetical protein
MSRGWPEPPNRYVIRSAFRLADPTDARKGVSGAVVAYEGGVLGLAHFARAEPVKPDETVSSRN